MENKEIWNKTAKHYNSIIKKDNKAYLKICDNINLIVKDKEVLEIGCGTGKVTKEICNNVKNIIAIDFSEEMIKIAKEETDSIKINYEVADATNLPYENKSFDVVVMVNCLHIIENPDIALKEVFRVLKDDGILIAPTFCNKGFIRTLFFDIGNLLFKYNFTKWKKEEYIDFLENNNFKVINSETIKASFPIEFIVCNKNNKF